MGAIDIDLTGMATAYLLLIIPLAILMWKKIPIAGKVLIAVVRMTVQLLLVGLYLQFVFKLDNGWLNIAWIFVMMTVADISIIRNCGLKVRVFAPTIMPALLLGTGIPLFWLIGGVWRRPNLLEAQYLIPIGGMIMGNCMRANIIGLKNFYSSIRNDEKSFRYMLAQGATLREATAPYLVQAFHAAISPTIATMMTVGLVSLPGMMTGVIMGGNDPMLAVKYQIGIMIAIFSGTAIALPATILFSLHRSFSPQGTLYNHIFHLG